MRHSSPDSTGRRGFGGIWFLFAAVFLLALDPGQPAHAYLDPGTGSILIQMLLGGVAGGIVIAKLYWHRLTSFFKRDQKDSEPAPSQPQE